MSDEVRLVACERAPGGRVMPLHHESWDNGITEREALALIAHGWDGTFAAISGLVAPRNVTPMALTDGTQGWVRWGEPIEIDLGGGS